MLDYVGSLIYFFFDYCLECTNLEDFKVFISDRYGLATKENLYEMNNMINPKTEQGENNQPAINIRPARSYFNCYDDDDDDSSTASSNSSDEHDVNFSIWNDKDSNIEYSSSNDDERKDN